MKIGIVHNYGLSGSGSNSYVLGLSCALQQLGHEVVVLLSRHQLTSVAGDIRDSSFDGRHYVGPYVFSGARHYSLTFRPYLGIETHTEYQADAFLASCSDVMLQSYISTLIEVVIDIAIRERLEVLHVNHIVPLPYIAAAVKARLAIPYVVTLHGSHISYVRDLDSGRSQPYLDQGLSEASRIIVTTNAVQRRCQAYVDISSDAFSLIPVGVDTRSFRRAIGVEADDLRVHDRASGRIIDAATLRNTRSTVVFVGKVIADKGVHLLPLIMAAVKHYRPKARLVVIGNGQLLSALVALARGETDLEAVSALAGRHRDPVDEYLASSTGWSTWDRNGPQALDDTVFLGFQSTEVIQAVLGGAEACVIPSLIDEALPMTALEAMSSGTLPVAEEKSGFSELMQRIKAVVPHAREILADLEASTGNPCIERYDRAIANALSVAGRSDSRDALQSSLRQLAVSDYDWRKIGEQVAATYQEAVE